MNEANCKEVQELFFELGYRWCALGNNVSYLQRISSTEFTHFVAWSVGSCKDVIQLGCGAEEATELTLPQLRDLVVLHRNDVKDATHKNTKENLGFLCSDGAEYFWNFGTKKWFKPENMTFKNKKMKPLHKEAEQGLISGAEKTIKVNGLDFLIEGKDALRSAIDGNNIQLSLEPWEVSSWSDFNPVEDEASTKVFFTGLSSDGQKVFFRLKPRTIKLEIEIPAPFEPKDDDRVWVLDVRRECGYGPLFFNSTEPKYTQFGAWDSEEKVKAVVAALRGGIKA